MAELALDDWQRDPLAGHLDRMGVPELMVVPTSAQPPLRRRERYAEAFEKWLLTTVSGFAAVGIFIGLRGTSGVCQGGGSGPVWR